MMLGVVAASIRRASVVEPEPSGPPAIGEYWAGQGGYYAGSITYNNQAYWLVLADVSAEVVLQWKTTQTATANTTDAYDGLANTLNMVSADATMHPAAAHCDAYAGGGYSDWYMPSQAELSAIRASLSHYKTSPPPLFSSDGAQAFKSGYLWSSTEASATSAYGVTATTSTSGAAYSTGLTKDQTTRTVRPIRRVSY